MLNMKTEWLILKSPKVVECMVTRYFRVEDNSVFCWPNAVLCCCPYSRKIPLAAEAAFQKVSIKMHSSSKNKDHTNFRYRPTSRLLLSTLIPKMWKLTSYVMFQTLDYTVCKNHQKCLIFIRLRAKQPM